MSQPHCKAISWGLGVCVHQVPIKALQAQCYSCHAHAHASHRWQAACCRVQTASPGTGVLSPHCKATVAATSTKAGLLPFTDLGQVAFAACSTHLPSSLKLANWISSTSSRLPCFFSSSCVLLLKSPSTAMMVKLTPGLVFRNEQLSSCEQSYHMSKLLTHSWSRAEWHASDNPDTPILPVCVFIADASSCITSKRLPIGEMRYKQVHLIGK